MDSLTRMTKENLIKIINEERIESEKEIQRLGELIKSLKESRERTDSIHYLQRKLKPNNRIKKSKRKNSNHK